MSATTAASDEPAVIGRVSTLDRFLPAWILVALVYVSLWLRRYFPSLAHPSGPVIAELATERP